MTSEQAAAERRTERMRGLMLGLALGESVGRRQHHGPVIAAGVGTQLAAFTLEGYIRAAVRMSHKGICDPPGILWRAYRRWAQGQGIAGVGADSTLGAGFVGAPDGWLREVPALRERRGNAPATVSALRGGMPGTPERPLNQSMGWHGLVRVLPLAIGAVGGAGEVGGLVGHVAPSVDLARRATALTHGSPVGLDVTSAGVAVAASCLGSDRVLDGLRAGLDAARGVGVPARLADDYEAAVLRDAAATPARALATLREVAPDRTAHAALAGGLYVAAAHPEPSRFVEALELAAQAPAGDSVAAVAGALLGASHGASQLPVDLVSRHELAWALDVLARDAVAELTDSPGGSEYVEARDEHWQARYPGW